MGQDYKVIFHPYEREQLVEEGCTILEAAKQCGILLDVPCGGNGICKKCRLNILVQGEEQTVYACRTSIFEDMEIFLPKEEKHKILLAGKEKEIEWNPIFNWNGKKEKWYMAAVDIGTTTIAGYLINGVTGKEEARASLLNPQVVYGADIMERCHFGIQFGIEKLNKAVVHGVNEVLLQLSSEAGIKTKDIMALAAAGNTCMNHLFGSISIDSLVKVPYHPAFYNARFEKGRDYALEMNEEGEVLLLPNIGGFVGSDTAAAMLCADIDTAESTAFLIDIGTNGEMVLGNQHERMACSTAAGPAFEGINISCGMRGADGAIDHVTMEQGQFGITTIGKKNPIGICGSGLIDAVAVMISHGFLDETGRILERNELTSPEAKKNQNRIGEADGEKVFLLVSPSIAKNKDGIYISQQDIREVQLAKGAILAGIHTLLKKMKIKISEVENVFLAGAFGFYLTKESACKVGIIPKQWKDKIQFLGNAAGEGAKEVLMNQEHFHRCEELAKNTKFLELASSSDFQQEFVKCINFTD